MQLSLHPLSLMLIGTFVLNLALASSHHHIHKNLGHWRLAGRDQSNPSPTIDSDASTISPCSGAGCVAVHPPFTSLPCAHANGTIITAGSSGHEWTMLCDIDFFAQDIFPFIRAGSFEQCLQYCDDYNQGNDQNGCAGFVFAPDRIHQDNDCYLKSSTNSIVSPATIHLVGATLIAGSTSTSTSAATPTDSGVIIHKYSDDRNEKPVGYTLKAQLLGTTTNKPSKQYVSHTPSLPIKLASVLLKPGINLDLVKKYPLAGDTGSWTEKNVPYNFELGNLSSIPRLSRDGGKGGNINGTHVFYFCDTSTFGDVKGPLGYMNGFVSSSASVDVGRKALDGDALELEDPIGQWQDDVGRLRGWIPMTTGEEAFNIAISGDGFRYAIWPESSFITLNQTHSLIYAPIVYVEVDMKTQHAEFTSLGNTLISVTVDPVYGPHADRLVNQLFTEHEVEWGSLGGLRAWTSSGRGTNDGMVYLFGQVDNGVLVARVPATEITNRAHYTYWNGTAWSSTIQGRNSTAYLVKQPVMDMDIFYAPICRCFIMIYLTPFADNTLYLRQLMTDYATIPPYENDGSEDYVERILQYPWSEPKALKTFEVPAEGYIYALGCHLGYFGEEDIINGGHKILVTWTEHTPVDPNNPASGYAHKSIVLV